MHVGTLYIANEAIDNAILFNIARRYLCNIVLHLTAVLNIHTQLTTLKHDAIQESQEFKAIDKVEQNTYMDDN